VIRTRVVIALIAVAAISGCSSSKRAPGSPDGGPGDAGDTGDASAGADCVQMQQAYVNGVVAPAQQTDVAATVRAVLAGSDVLQAMPYCSGARPVRR
jgi:hypothetical protein